MASALYHFRDHAFCSGQPQIFRFVSVYCRYDSDYDQKQADLRDESGSHGIQRAAKGGRGDATGAT
jgi:hypothetical protein